IQRMGWHSLLSFLLKPVPYFKLTGCNLRWLGLGILFLRSLPEAFSTLRGLWGFCRLKCTAKFFGIFLEVDRHTEHYVDLALQHARRFARWPGPAAPA
ncbi:hypothetical protein NW841_11935, partial [Synechococcus sp. H60.3]